MLLPLKVNIFISYLILEFLNSKVLSASAISQFCWLKIYRVCTSTHSSRGSDRLPNSDLQAFYFIVKKYFSFLNYNQFCRAGHSLIYSGFAIRSPLNFFPWIADAHAFIFWISSFAPRSIARRSNSGSLSDKS
jgi:hypothetical protein